MTLATPPLPECTHGNVASLHPTGKPVHAWTHIYWPVALVLAVLLFFVPYYGSLGGEGWGLLAGALLLGIPELITLLTGNAQDTFSDWVWASAHIVAGEAIQSWNAEHYLLACVYVFIAVNVIVYLAGVIWWAGLASALFASWLLFHFWGRWWT